MDKLKEKEKENALNEVRLLASIHHPHIIAYKDSFVDESS
jgi:NIMA (never in mitosis gene a)-related kinase